MTQLKKSWLSRVVRQHKETTKVTLGSRPPGTVAAARVALTDTAPLIVSADYTTHGLYSVRSAGSPLLPLEEVRVLGGGIWYSNLTHNAGAIVYLRIYNPTYKAVGPVQCDQTVDKTKQKYATNILIN